MRNRRGLEIATVGGRGKIVFRVDQLGRRRSSRGVVGSLPVRIGALTRHESQSKCISPQIGDLSGASRSQYCLDFAPRTDRRGEHRRDIRNLAGMQIRRSVRGVLAVLCAATVVAGSSAGCAKFNNDISQPFTTAPQLAPGPSSTPPPPPPLPPKPFPKACPAPGVMQGCLESTSGLIMGPDSKTALVAERTTGAVKDVSVSAEPKIHTVIPSTRSGDGGLMDIVLSPTYSQDRLMYAYISTPDRQPGDPGGRRRHPQADPDRDPQGRHR